MSSHSNYVQFEYDVPNGRWSANVAAVPSYPGMKVILYAPRPQGMHLLAVTMDLAPMSVAVQCLVPVRQVTQTLPMVLLPHQISQLQRGIWISWEG